MNFNAPIPGESLTGQPKGMPYERPPEIVKAKDAAEYHVNNLSNPERISHVIDVLEMGVTIEELTKGVIRGAVSQGIHTIDTGLTIAPVIHRFIKKVAIDANIDYEEGFKQTKEEVEQSKKVQAQKYLRQLRKTKDMPEEEPTPTVEVEEEPQGFMQRRDAK